jgi:hypothetical protein
VHDANGTPDLRDMDCFFCVSLIIMRIKHVYKDVAFFLSSFTHDGPCATEKYGKYLERGLLTKTSGIFAFAKTSGISSPANARDFFSVILRCSYKFRLFREEKELI